MMNGRSSSARILLALLALAVTLATWPAWAAEPTSRFEPIGDYDFEIDGKIIPKMRMYYSKEAAALLVTAAELSYPIAVVPRNKTIQKLNPADLRQEAAGSLAWTPAKPPEAVGTFELVEDKPVFTLEGKKMRFLNRKPLLGPQTREDILEYDPSYAYRAASANPPTVYLPQVNQWPTNAVIRLYFSTQCDVCRELLPGIFKFQEKVTNPKIKWEFYGMPTPASKDPKAVELKITTFPTGIFYAADGKEIGRAVGHSWRMPDLAINNALLGITVDPNSLRVPESSKPSSGR
jgi:hypothetical protein